MLRARLKARREHVKALQVEPLKVEGLLVEALWVHGQGRRAALGLMGLGLLGLVLDLGLGTVPRVVLSVPQVLSAAVVEGQDRVGQWASAVLPARQAQLVPHVLQRVRQGGVHGEGLAVIGGV